MKVQIAHHYARNKEINYTTIVAEISWTKIWQTEKRKDPLNANLYQNNYATDGQKTARLTTLKTDTKIKQKQNK